MVPEYKTRKYTLTANEPQDIPPFSALVMVGASQNDNRISISLGDANGSFEPLVVGVAVYMQAQNKAKIVSTITQEVTLMIAANGVTFIDYRPDMLLAFASTTSVYVSGNGAASGVLVNGVDNINGVEVLAASCHPQATGALDGRFEVRGGAAVLFAGVLRQISVNHQFIMPQAWLLSPGLALSWHNVNATQYAASITYRVR